MSFENIIGNKKIKSEFIETIKNNTLSHSYLFVGQEGIGKKLFAKELAKMALCLSNANGFKKTVSDQEENVINNDNTNVIGNDNCSSCVKFVRAIIQTLF